MACKNALKIKNINNMADNVQPATTEKKVTDFCSVWIPESRRMIFSKTI